MIKRHNVKDLDLLQDDIGAWYYQLNGVPYTGSAFQLYPNGIIAAEHCFVGGYEEGLQRIWFQNGQLKIECQKNNNISHGKSLEWFDNGVLRFDAEYSMGRLVCGKIYDEKGVLIEEI